MDTAPAGEPHIDASPQLSEIADQCFLELEDHVLAGGEVTDEHLARLGILLGRNWTKALQAVDSRSVSCFTAERSGRTAYLVQGRGATYLTIPRHYCSCQAHYYEVVCKAEAVYCKHQVAARLARILGRCNQTTVSDTTLAAILIQG